MSKLLAGRYELTDKIGEGGMAVVYKAKDRLLNRYVAIKILRPEYTKDDTFVESFKRESQAAAGLQHPNIVAVYDVGRSGSINYIVMELVDGRPLSDIIDEKGPLDYKTTIDISKQMASALSLAHKHQIVHRDVKPHNILMTSDGVAKLTDFGIAKAISNSTMVADTKKIIGSVHYFSPEQARGASVDERSDIYSLGIVMYEMLTGRVPFDGDTPVEVALKHINEEIIPPSKLVSGIPPALEKAVLKATDKFQGNRYSSADELLEDLKNIEFITSMVGSSVYLASGKPAEGRSVAAADIVKPEEKPEKPVRKETSVRSTEGRGGRGKNSHDEDKERKKKIMIICGIAAGVILVLLGVLYAMGLLGGKGGSEIEVPDLKNKTVEEATKMLEELGLKIETSDQAVASEEIEEGKIVSQQPAAGTNVKEGRTVTVTLSSGTGILKAPNLAGKSYDDAKSLLSDMGLKISQGESVSSETVAEGLVAEQYPSEGTELEKGDTITVYLSAGSKVGMVPSLIGKEFTSENDLQALLYTYGYQLGSVDYRESYDTPGLIIDQYPAAGTEAEKNTAIDIVISKAKETGEVPDLYNKSLLEAQEILTDAGFSPGVVTENESEEVAEGRVLRQYPEAGTEYELGSTIDVWVAVAPVPEEPEPVDPEPVDPEPSGGDDTGDGGDETGDGGDETGEDGDTSGEE